MSYLLLLGIYFIVNLYCIARTRSLLHCFTWANKTVNWCILSIYFVTMFLPILGAFLPKTLGLYTFQKYGNLFFGLFAYYEMLLILGEIILWIGRKHRLVVGKLLLCVAVSGSIGLNVYGIHHAQDTKLTSYTVKTNTNQNKNLKIVLLGDLHLSVNSNINMTKNMVKMVNAQKADMVLIAGDIFTSSYDGLKNPGLYAKELRKMKSTYGTYVVYGNHDVDETLFSGFSLDDPSVALRPKSMEEFMVASNFHMLGDKVKTFDELGIQIVGRLDAKKNGKGSQERMSAKDLLKKTNSDYTQIVLEHEPLEFKQLSKNGADLVLCGHTHNGQIFPGNLFVGFFNENAYGYKEMYGTPTIVTSGVGYYGPPIRVGTDSEVVVLNVVY